jgi:hypothetical protein
MEAPTRASQLRCWSPLWTSLAALGLFTVPLACISSIALNDQVFKLARYLSVPALLVVPPPSGYGRAGQPAGQGGPRRHPGRPGSARPGQRRGGHWHLGLGWNGSGRYVATNQSLVQTHELGRFGSALKELSVVAGVLLVIANVGNGTGSSRR